MKVLVTGATGFVGRVVVRQLLQGGDQVVVLTRNIPKAALILGSECEYFQWIGINDMPPLEAFQGVDAVINLMGEGIADHSWTDEQKKRIYDSRIQGTRRIVEACKSLGDKSPKALVSTSAVGIYGNRYDEELLEGTTLSNDFLGQLCQDWESEARAAEANRMRVAIIRVGVVLGRGGALAKMLPIFKLGAGGPLGSGKQWMSWVHVEDLAGMFVRAAREKEFNGIYNGTAPYPVINKDFTKVLGKVLKRPTFAPAPAFAIKMAFGERSQVLLEGQRVVPKRLHDEAHFHYRYPTLEMALKETAY